MRADLLTRVFSLGD